MSQERVTVRFPNRVLLSIQDVVEDGPAFSQSQAIEKAVRDKFGPSKRFPPRRFDRHSESSNLADPEDLSPNTRLSFRLPDEVLERLETVSDAGFYMDRSAAIRDACREAYLEDIPAHFRANSAVEALFNRAARTEAVDP